MVQQAGGISSTDFWRRGIVNSCHLSERKVFREAKHSRSRRTPVALRFSTNASGSSHLTAQHCELPFKSGLPAHMVRGPSLSLRACPERAEGMTEEGAGANSATKCCRSYLPRFLNDNGFTRGMSSSPLRVVWMAKRPRSQATRAVELSATHRSVPEPRSSRGRGRAQVTTLGRCAR